MRDLVAGLKITAAHAHGIDGLSSCLCRLCGQRPPSPDVEFWCSHVRPTLQAIIHAWHSKDQTVVLELLA
eukprot:10853873-Karenia_brevis.AAC.1